MRLSLIAIATSLALVAITSFCVLLPQQAHAATDCPAGSVKITSDQNPSLFSSSPTAAYACSSTDGVNAGNASFSFFDASGNLLKSGVTINSGDVSKTDESGKPVPKGPITCSGLTDFFLNAGTCIGRSIAAFIGTALITVTAWLLQVAGLIFNWLMYYTVIAFGDATNGFLTTGVLNAINLTWTAFRDISNIVIIGMFTFIAISIILGLNQFGSKKLIARVLIVAILINFSLLFTKVIIDFTNFASFVFYNSMPSLQLTTSQTLTSPFVQDGVAGQFIRFMGVTSVSDTFSTLKQGADSIDSGWVILLHGVFGATLLLLAALAFIYGSFLLLVRAVVLVFLLITSSFAFATYLIPKLSESGYGWNAWWKALFQNAIFAPLLMALLWATLLLAQALRPAGGTLGALLKDPSNAGNLSALFSYIIVLGFLVASLKVSSSVASSISGFNFAALNIARLGVAPLALGSRFLAAPALRTVVGGRAARRSLDLEEKLATERANMASLSGADRIAAQNRYLKLQKEKTSADKTAKRDFNAMNLETNKQLAKALGLKGVLAGEKKVGGYEGPRKEAAKEAAATGAGAAISADQAQKLAEERKSSDKQYQMQKEAIQAEISAANTMKEAAKSNSGQINQLKQGLTEAMREAASQSAQGIELSERLKRGGKTAEQIQSDSNFREQQEKIKAAHQHVTNLQSQIDTLSKPIADAEATERAAKQKLEKFDKEYTKILANTFMKSSTEAAEDIAAHESHGDEYVARVARKMTKEKIGNKRLVKQLKAQKEVEKELTDAGEIETEKTT